MSLLLLDRAQLELKAEGDTLALYESGARRSAVPVKLIERCVVHGAQTSLTSGVLLKLAEAGVTTVFMSPRQTRSVALVLGPSTTTRQCAWPRPTASWTTPPAATGPTAWGSPHKHLLIEGIATTG